MHPHHPCPPAPSAGFLLQKIIACEKRHLPCVTAEWCFQAIAPGSIRSVTPCGSPSWTRLDHCRLRIILPVSVQLCDACGQCSQQLMKLEVETALPHSFETAICDPRNTLLILPCIRLLKADCTCAGCLRVHLSVALEMYLLRYEPTGTCAPVYPQLPLYPQPVC